MTTHRVVLVGLLAAAVPSLSSAQDCSRVSARHRPAIVHIAVEGVEQRGGAVVPGTGTGILVSAEGHVLAADHIRYFGPGEFKATFGGSIGSIGAGRIEMQIVSAAPEHDLLLLKFADTSRLYPWRRAGDESGLRQGTPLCSLGFPGQLELRTVSGTLGNTSGFAGSWTLVMPTEDGESGSPVFDQRGELVGIRNASYKDAASAVTMIPISSARLLLQGLDRRPRLYDRGVLWSVGGSFTSTSVQPNLPSALVTHSNHADDAAFLTGPAGDTGLQDVGLRGIELEAGMAYGPARKNVAIVARYVAKLNAARGSRFQQQQANDPRPPASGSFIYTRLAEVSPAHAARMGVAAAWPLDGNARWWVEAEGTVDVGRWSMEFEKGWSRFGRDEVELSSKAQGFELSPRLQVSLGTPRLAVEGSVTFLRVRLDHGSAAIESHTLSGVVFGIGGSIRFH